MEKKLWHHPMVSLPLLVRVTLADAKVIKAHKEEKSSYLSYELQN